MERCANRTHGLSRPPPVRVDARLNRFGCMTCSEGPRPCPLREAYGCSEEDRSIGLALGYCILEKRVRDEARAKLLADVSHVPVEEAHRAVHLVELALDAMVYRDRAATWTRMVHGPRSARVPLKARDAFWRAYGRYFYGAAQRVTNRLSPVLRYARLSAIRKRRGEPQVLDSEGTPLPVAVET